MPLAQLPVDPEEWQAIARRLGLPPREAEVVHGILDDLDCPDIAQRLTLSTRTVRFHLEHVYRKLGVRRRHQVVLTVFAEHLRRCNPTGR
jgi:DNA-binding NarL/FixJ family response regulator